MDDLEPTIHTKDATPEIKKQHRNVVAQREAELVATMERQLPDFVALCRATHGLPLILHQDAFAGDYQESEYRLLGMAIKFAGICEKEIHIHGRNRETLN
jgi:hypothetical protein